MPARLRYGRLRHCLNLDLLGCNIGCPGDAQHATNLPADACTCSIISRECFVVCLVSRLSAYHHVICTTMMLYLSCMFVDWLLSACWRAGVRLRPGQLLPGAAAPAEPAGGRCAHCLPVGGHAGARFRPAGGGCSRGGCHPRGADSAGLLAGHRYMPLGASAWGGSVTSQSRWSQILSLTLPLRRLTPSGVGGCQACISYSKARATRK